MRFKNAVHAHDGTEKEKVAAAQLHHPRPPSMPIPSCFTCKAERGPTRRVVNYACNTRTYFCNKQCQIDGWKEHKAACKKARKRKKLNYSKDKMLVVELLSVAMRGGGRARNDIELRVIMADYFHFGEKTVFLATPSFYFIF